MKNNRLLIVLLSVLGVVHVAIFLSFLLGLRYVI